MPKAEDNNIIIWNTLKKHLNRDSVAKVPKGPEQLQAIRDRLQSLTDDLASIGAAVTPIAIQSALSLDNETFNRWKTGQASQRDEKGNHTVVSLEKANISDDEKQYIIDRANLIKNYLQQGELFAGTAAQTKDNRENGGSLFILQNVYGYGQEKQKDIISVSLEDLLAAAAKIKERAQV